VAKELPPKTEMVRAIDLTGAQRELYESIRVAAHAEVREHIKSSAASDGSHHRVLDALLKLRQVAAIRACVGRRRQGRHRPLAKLDDAARDAADPARRGPPHPDLLAVRPHARPDQRGLLGHGVGHVTLTGATPDRQKPIDAFEKGRADVFLISLKAGGTGLNLTSADTVIHYDPWWNPAMQAQATDRAYRIGQKKPVFAYNLIASGSVEERMLGCSARRRSWPTRSSPTAARRRRGCPSTTSTICSRRWGERRVVACEFLVGRVAHLHGDAAVARIAGSLRAAS
jgi:ERCC4-related helicase